MTIRANTLHVARDALAAALAADGIETHAGALGPDALLVDTRTNLFGLAAFQRGDFEAQDEGSQMLAGLVDPKGIVIDLCAGAGGKTLAMAAAMKNKGRIFASDVDDKKLEELRRRARRAGVTNTQTVAPDKLRDGADRVLVDAPCS